uniref:Uncharacterized protein n=1 Tax=Psilocybe cubensis TaxID=181762 RepID=A0A8H7Y5Y9_PSICU
MSFPTKDAEHRPVSAVVVEEERGDFSSLGYAGDQGDVGRKGSSDDPTSERGYLAHRESYLRNVALLTLAQRLYFANDAVIYPTGASSGEDIQLRIDDVEGRRRAFQRVATEAAALARTGGVKGVMKLNDEIAVNVIRDLEIVLE